MSQITHYLDRLLPARPAMLTTGPTPHEQEVTSQHYAYLQGLNHRGVLFTAGRTLDPARGVFGIAILRADSEAEARAIMQNDPAVKNGVMHAELFPYRIAFAP